MNNETYIDFCFIRNESGSFSREIGCLLSELFKGLKLNWYLEEKSADGAEMVIAEVKGMSGWRSEEETVNFIEEHARDTFWNYLQGYKIFIYPVTMRGCSSCGAN